MARTGKQATELAWLLLEIRRLEGCETTKAKTINLMRQLVGQKVFFARRDLIREDEVKRARAMLDRGTPRPMAARALQDALKCSRRKAYNLIHDALNQRTPSIKASKPG